MKTQFIRLTLPFAFIVLYGSGFVFTGLGLQHSSPILFLTIRFFFAFILLVSIAWLLKAAWPQTFKEFFHICTAGSMTVGVFSIGVFLSLSYGVSPSLSALIIALQPILVALLAMKFLNEQMNYKIWLGLFIGLLGVSFVVVSKIDMNGTALLGVSFSIMALLGLSFGNIYQKKFCTSMNLFSGGALQTFSSTLLTLPFLYFEEIKLEWAFEFSIALFYMTVCVSIGALSLLYIMIKQGEVSKVASIFYLVPVSAAVIGYFVLDAALEWNILVGILMVLLAIVIVNKKPKNKDLNPSDS